MFLKDDFIQNPELINHFHNFVHDFNPSDFQNIKLWISKDLLTSYDFSFFANPHFSFSDISDNSLFSTSSQDLSVLFAFSCYIIKSFYNHDDLLQFEGFEVWPNSRDTPYESHQFHIDKDEFVFTHSRKLLPPHESIVYFSSHPDTPVIGGELVIANTPYNVSDANLAITLHTHNYQKINFVDNRIIAFNGGKFPHFVLPLLSGKRFSIAINSWKQKPHIGNF